MVLSTEECMDFCALFKRAERLLRRIDLALEEAIIPGINELRYAGSHYCKATTTDDLVTARKEIEEALTHIRRGMYDSIIFGVAYKMAFITRFRKRYNAKYVRISSVVPGYHESLARVRTLGNELGSVTRDEALDNGYINHIEEEFDFLNTFTTLLISAEEELGIEVTKVIWKFVGGTVGGVAAVAAIIAFVCA